jgi:hypothetical protein
MRSLIRVGLVVALASACKPAPLDPDAIFTIEGHLVNPDGSDAAYTTVRMYKVDFWDAAIFIEDSFLHVPVVGSQGLQGEFSTTSDADGHFRWDLRGAELNSETGGAGSLSVVHQLDGDMYAYVATATDWYTFTNNNPMWDTGELRLWDSAGATAQQNGASVNFNWGTQEAPSGFENDGERPYFLFAYDNGSPTLQWGEHTFSSNATVPRSAFSPSASMAPEWFLVGYMRENSGSRTYMMRTGLKTAGPWYSDSTSQLATTLRQDGSTFATDGVVDIDSAYHFSVGPTEITATLNDGLSPVSDVLVYGLGVANLRNAEIQLEGRNGTSYTILETYMGDRDFENWLYLGWTGNEMFEEIVISVSNRTGGAAPYFLFVDEVEVRY